MLERILNNLETYLGDEYEVDLCTLLVNKCLENLKRARNYPENYTETMINDDLKNYEYKIFDLVLDAFNKRGVENEKSHSENGISVSFIDDEKLYSGILPIARVI